MSNFERAYSRTMGNEGGYANNPLDRGGETYKGISRNKCPKWAGWRTVDTVKASLVNPSPYGTGAYREWVKHFNSLLATIASLQASVQTFYQQNFWNRLGEITDQRVAEEVFDKAVNCGGVAYRWLQRAVSVTDDGVIGQKTLTAVNATDPRLVLSAFNKQARHYYDGIIEHDPTQAVFRKSWYARLRTYEDAPAVA